VCSLALATASMDGRLFKSLGPVATQGGEIEFLVWILPPADADRSWSGAEESERLEAVLQAALPNPYDEE
jgi:hypothetical protein